MSTIPFSEVVQVVPSVLSAGGIAVDLNGLMLTQNSLAPYGTILEFSNAAGVNSYFGPTSTESNLANVYFNGYSIGTQLPGSLLITNYPETSIAGWLRSGSFASITLGQLQAYTGTLIISVAGVAHTSGTINLTSATSFSNAATIIQAAFTTPPFVVTYSSINSAFIFTTTTTDNLQLTTGNGERGTGNQPTPRLRRGDASLRQGYGVAMPAYDKATAWRSREQEQ